MEKMQKFIRWKREKRLAGSKMRRRQAKKSARTTTMQIERRQSANQSDKLWRNYQSLLYLEDSRDEILRGVHQELTDDDIELEIRTKSFREVEEKSHSMLKQISSVIHRLQALKTYDHQLLKTCVKIVDNEERRDSEAVANVTDGDGGHFMPPRRAKGWMQKCLDIIKSGIAKRVEETAPSTDDLGEDKDGTRLLIRLTAARDVIVRDLKQAESLSTIFTSEWNMYDTYVMAYYEDLMSKVQERFSFELSESATVEILSWMIHCRDRVFNCQNSECKPCQMIADLQTKFLREKKEHIHHWMESALQKDTVDWQSAKQPMGGSLGLYTEFPIDILQMLEENINQAKDISPELHGHIADICLVQLDKIMASYTENVKAYISQEPATYVKSRAKKHHVLKDTRPAHFVQYSVALLNNFDKISSHLRHMTAEFNNVQKETTENSRNNNNRRLEEEPMKALIGKIETQTQECSVLLWPQLQHDLNGDLHSLLTRTWLLGNGIDAVDTMCNVMESYLVRLRGPLQAWLIPAIEEMLIAAYARGLTDKRMRLAGRKAERLQVSAKLCAEVQQLERFFLSFSETEEQEQPSTKARSTQWDVIRDMAGVLQIDNEETAITDITVLASKYPDMAEKQASRLLKVRGDFTRAQIKKIVAASMGKSSKKHRHEGETIFSKLPLK